MGGGRDNQHDLVAGLQRAVAVHDAGGLQGPPLPGLRLDLFKGLFGHAGPVLQLHRADGLTASHIADQAGKGHDSADIGADGRQRTDFLTDVKILDLNRNTHQPPVIGGKNATSAAPVSEASISVMV